MCIRLTRVHECRNLNGTIINHRRSWIIRCSTPDIVGNAILDGQKRQPCLESLDEIVEYYATECDNCTGRSCVEFAEPFHTISRSFKADHPDESSQLAYNAAIQNYHRMLAQLLGVNLKARAWHNFQELRGTDEFGAKVAFLLRHIIPELHCRSEPAHDYWNPFRGQTCPCGKLEWALHNNPATDVRGKLALALLGPHASRLEAGHADYDQTLVKWEAYLEERLKALGSSRARRHRSSDPVLDVLPYVQPFTAAQARHRRAYLTSLLDAEFSRQNRRLGVWPSAGLPSKQYAFISNAVDIMILDVGLPLPWAADVLALFFPMLSPRDAGMMAAARSWAEDDPVALDRYIAHFIEDFWRSRPAAPFDDLRAQYPQGSLSRFVYWAQSSWHGRVGEFEVGMLKVLKSVVMLNENQVARLAAGGVDGCGLCGVRFAKAEAPLERPVLLASCRRHGRHIFGQRCLLRLAREQLSSQQSRVGDVVCPLCSAETAGSRGQRQRLVFS